MIEVREILDLVEKHRANCCDEPAFLQVREAHRLAHALDVMVLHADTLVWLFGVPVCEDEDMPFDRWNLLTIAGEILGEGTLYGER